MKRIVLIAMVLLLTAALVLVTGCQQAAETTVTDTGSVSVSQTSAPTRFKTGTWACWEGVNYVFYGDGISGKNFSVADKMGIGFAYELNPDGSCVFHMGSSDDNTKATVEFMDGGDNTATITWEDGSRIVLMFISDDISDSFAESYIMGTPTAE